MVKGHLRIDGGQLTQIIYGPLAWEKAIEKSTRKPLRGRPSVQERRLIYNKDVMDRVRPNRRVQGASRLAQECQSSICVTRFDFRALIVPNEEYQFGHHFEVP